LLAPEVNYFLILKIIYLSRLTIYLFIRFGKCPIKSHYEVRDNADFVSVNKDVFIQKYDTVSALKQGGILLLNSKYNSAEELEKYIPHKYLKIIA